MNLLPLHLLYLWGLWLLLGALVGLLANGANLRPENWGKLGWLNMIFTGMAGATIGGFCGIWIFGGLFATATALWIAVVAVGVPWLYEKVRGRAMRS